MRAALAAMSYNVCVDAGEKRSAVEIFGIGEEETVSLTIEELKKVDKGLADARVGRVRDFDEFMTEIKIKLNLPEVDEKDL